MSENPLEGLSADVAAIMGHSKQKEDLANLPRWKRNQVKRDKARVKITVDLTDYQQLAERLRQLAEDEHCGTSGMAIHLLVLGMEHYREPKKIPSRSRLYDYDIVPHNGFDT